MESSAYLDTTRRAHDQTVICDKVGMRMCWTERPRRTDLQRSGWKRTHSKTRLEEMLMENSCIFKPGLYVYRFGRVNNSYLAKILELIK